MIKVVENAGEDEDFKSGTWVSATDYMNANGGIVSGCLGDIKNFLFKNGKLDQVVAIVKHYFPNVIGDLIVTLKDLSGIIPSTIYHKVIDEGGYGKDITVGAALILANVLVFSPKPSIYYLNIIMRNVVKVFRKDTVSKSGSVVVCGNVTDQKDLYKFDEEALNLTLEEESRKARAEHEWLEKCRQEEEFDKEHERQL
ncbi:homeobox-leucine zipper protein HDG11 [Tanacetum coccineum]